MKTQPIKSVCSTVLVCQKRGTEAGGREEEEWLLSKRQFKVISDFLLPLAPCTPASFAQERGEFEEIQGQ